LNAIPFLVCFCFSPVGSGVDVSNEYDIKIYNTGGPILVHQWTSQEEESWISILFGYQQQGKQPPSQPMISKYFKTYYFVPHGSTVFYR
jgi:hypothetical protein